MYVVVHHRVTDREKFLATSPEQIGGNAPAGVQVRHFLPARDASAADCLWEVESLGALQREHVLRGRLGARTGPAAERFGEGLDTFDWILGSRPREPSLEAAASRPLRAFT
jgi:hypothetical protein